MASARSTLPNEACLVQFLRSAKRCAGRSVVADTAGFDKTYNELLPDVLSTRDLLRERLPSSALDERGLLRAESPYVCVLAKGGYEVIVASFAIRAIGGACIPIASGALPEEAAYFIEISKSCCILAGQAFLDRAQQAAALVKEQSGAGVLSLPISSDASPLREIDIEIDDGPVLDPSAPGLVIFTSGTTGRPKGVVLPRRIMSCLPDAAVGAESICFRPAHWLGGFLSMMLPPATGQKIHVAGETASAKQLWDGLLNNPISSAAFSPYMLRLMRDYLESKDSHEQARLLSSFKRFRSLDIAGSSPSPTLIKFWLSKLGLPCVNVYASTELGCVSLVKVLFTAEKTNCIGKPASSAIEVKLTEGDHGEMLIKTPSMFLHYLGAEEATKAAFDEDGYFRTGDYAELKDGEYYFCGRASVDYAFCQGFSVPTLQVELALTSLPYIASACVLGVPDHEAKEICGAVVRLTPEAQRRQSSTINGIANGSTDGSTNCTTVDASPRITLRSICEDLHPLLPRYMHPRILRFIDAEEDMPQTVSQKPIKRLVINKFFGIAADGCWDAGKPMAAEGVEWRESRQVHVPGETKPWDWAGLTVYPEEAST